MCAIFGLLDYGGKLTPKKRLDIVRALGKAAEVRGTDASGIAYVQNGASDMFEGVSRDELEGTYYMIEPGINVV